MPMQHKYQLVSTRKLTVGDYVEINGPFDKHGIIWKSEPCSGGFLNLICACRSDKNRKPTYSW